MTESIEKNIRQIVSDQIQKETTNRKLATRSYVLSQLQTHNTARHNDPQQGIEMNPWAWDLMKRVSSLEKQARCLFAKTDEIKKEMTQNEKDHLDDLVESFMNTIPPGCKFSKTQKKYIAERLFDTL